MDVLSAKAWIVDIDPIANLLELLCKLLWQDVVGFQAFDPFFRSASQSPQVLPEVAISKLPETLSNCIGCVFQPVYIPIYTSSVTRPPKRTRNQW